MLYNKKFSKSLKPLLDFSHERVTAMRLDTASHPILLINVYFPYYNSRDIETHMSLYRDTIGFVENVIMQNPDCKTMILADLNCNLFDVRHPYTKLVREMMNRHNLISCFDTVENFDKQSSYTRYDVKTGSYTLIDGILISDELKGAISNVRISLHGDNLSDHCPVELDIEVSISKSSYVKPKLPLYVNWKKLSETHLDRFKTEMETHLSSIDTNHGGCYQIRIHTSKNESKL